MNGLLVQLRSCLSACLPIIGIVWLCLGVLRAQEGSQKDSLSQRWQDASITPAERLQALDRLIVQHYTLQDPDSARHYGEQLLEMAITAEDSYYQAAGYHHIGHALLQIGRYEEARSQEEKAIEHWQSVDAPKRLARSYNSLGIILRRLRQLDEAMAYLQKSIAIEKKLGDTLEIAKPYLGIAAIYELQGDIFQSLTYNQKALAITGISHDSTLRGIAHISLANNYKSLGDVANSADQYLKARAIYDRLDNPARTIDVLNNLAVLLIDNQEYDEVESYLKEALQIAEDKGLLRASAFVNANLGYLWTSQNKNEEGLIYFQKAYQIHVENDLGSLGAYIERQLGSTLLTLQRWEEAEKLLLKGLAGSLQMGSPIEIAYAEYSLSTLYQKSGDWSKSYQYAQQAWAKSDTIPDLMLQLDVSKQLLANYIHFGQNTKAAKLYDQMLILQDSVYQEENKRALIEQEFQYEYRQKAYQDSVSTSTQLALKDQENTRRRTISNFLLAGLALMLLFGFILWNRFRLTRRQKRIIEQEKGKLDQAYTDLDQEKNKLDQANAKLLELDRFKSRFFTNLSHEFRTPLTVIGGMIQQIETNPQRWVKQGSDIIQKNVSSLLSLINQILDLRKLESGSLSLSVIQGDIVQYLKLQTEAVRSLADSKKVQLSFQSEEEAILMDFDPDKLLLIHTNLLSNAIKFTPTGGEVAVSLAKPESHRLMLEVSDTGIGIPSDKIPLIFDRFYQADNEQTRAGEGTGIGLSLTQELVQFMGGQIEVESKEREGSSFRVYLPITQEAPLQKDIPIVKEELVLPAIARDLVEPVPSFATDDLPSLLIIEDNPDIVTYLQASLEDAYRLLIARDGQEGIELAVEQVPDLIISDVMMPKKDGYEVTQILKSDERTSHIPVILLTAKADHDSRLEGLEKGADAYLTKPFDQRELFIRLEKLLALRRNLQARYANAAATPPPQEKSFALEDAFIQKIRTLILDKLEESDYRIEDVCRDLGTSRTQLHNKIKALTGKSTTKFLRSIRLEKAKELLQLPESRVTEVAYATGFTDPYYFTRVFTKEFGTSPTSWREAALR
ncbi:MAG: tetratricopeptide repeat protein [Bacteroidota bacterium]